MLAMVYSGALRGAGDTRSPFLITLFSMWGIRIVGSVIVVKLLHKDLPWVCTAMCTDNIVRFFLYLWKYRQGKWVSAASPAHFEKKDSEPQQTANNAN